MKFDKDWIIIILLFGIIAFLSWKIYTLNDMSRATIEQIHYKDSNKDKYNIIYYDQTIASLKQTNKSLYDSLKLYKEQIDYLIQFKYKKQFHVDTIFIDTTKSKDVNTYAFSDTLNDTLKYNLQIGSKLPPNWYKLDVELADEFTIINNKYNDVNNTTISSSNGSTITDVTVFKKKSNKILDNFSTGPSINVGYDVLNKNFGIMVGWAITYKIDFKK